jgi:hypothetical protein
MTTTINSPYRLRQAGIPDSELGLMSTHGLVHASALVDRNYTICVVGDRRAIKTQSPLFEEYRRDKAVRFEVLTGCYYHCYGTYFANQKCLEECESILGRINTSWIVRSRVSSEMWYLHAANKNSPDLKAGKAICGIDGAFVVSSVPVPDDVFVWDRAQRPPHVCNQLSWQWLRGLARAGSENPLFLPLLRRNQPRSTKFSTNARV